MGTEACLLVIWCRAPEARDLGVLTLRLDAEFTAFFLAFLALADEAEVEFVWALAGLTWLANTTAKHATTVKDEARFKARDRDGKEASFSCIEGRAMV